MGLLVEVRAPDGGVRQVRIDRPTVVGREGDLVVDDPAVSRRHLRLSPTTDGEGTAEDLGSSHGTSLNGSPLAGASPVRPGDRLVVGDTVLTVLRARTTPEPQTPGGDGRVRVVTDGSAYAEQVAPAVRAKAERVWRRLGGLLPGGSALSPTIFLVAPFPDPDDAEQAVTEGSVIDEGSARVWTVATAGTPVDDPGRTLALVLTGHLPGGRDLALLLEGYGLHLSGIGDTDGLVRRYGLVAPSLATGPLRPAVAVSFVRYLLQRSTPDELEQLLRTARAGALDAALRETYGRGLAALEQGWANAVRSGGGGVPLSTFVKLSAGVFRTHRWRQIEILLYMLLGLAFTAAFPFVTKRLFDTAIPSGEMSEVLQTLAVLAGAFVLSLLAGLRQAQLSSYVSGSVIRDLRRDMFERLQAAPLAWFDRYPQGDLISRLFSDVRMVEAGLSQTISQGISSVLSLVVSTTIMFTVAPILAVMVLIGAPAVAVVYRVMGAGSRQRSVALQEEMAALMSVAGENAAAQPVVKLFGLGAREEARFGSASARVFRAERRLVLFGGLFGLSVNLIVTFLRLAVLGVGSWLVLEGRLTVGGLVAFLSIMGEAITPVTTLTGIGRELQQATGALMRVNEVLHAPVEGADPDTPVEVLPPLEREIRFERVGFSYDGVHPVLHDVTCTIPAGAKVAFVGPSGSGKSTILRLLMRLHDPDSGRIVVDGTDLRTGDLAAYRRQLGVVFQDPFLFDATIRDNVLLGRPDASDADLQAAVHAAEVDAFLDRLPRGLDTVVGERGGRLSGGQRQRVSIARALIRQPRLLLLDEATSALDPQTERQIVRTLDAVSQGRTTVSITHRLASVTDYDMIFVVDHGRIVESGRHPDLLAAGGVYATLWREQHGEEPTVPRPVAGGTRVLAAVGVTPP